jgi:predicted ATP-grasp superfamily ATP-dependent carboligase
VVKGVYSSGSQQVGIARDATELEREVRRIAALREEASLPLPIVQEYVPGRGYGLTALMRRGQPVATFMHRRLAEHDVSRGTHFAHAATGAESVEEAELRDSGLELLKGLCWDGMAMVEFRRDLRDGRFRLMEINPRFVGTLDLALAAGVDFPWLYVQLAAGRPVAGPNRYRVGLKYRWLLSKNVALAFEHPVSYWFGVLSTWRFDTKCDLSLRDPKPHWTHLRDAAWWVREHLRGSQPAPAIRGPLSPVAAAASEAPVEELVSGTR